MKIIFKIARAELQKLFYSPIAWLILVIFAFQSGLVFNSTFSELIRAQELGAKLGGITRSIYTDMFFGLFPRVLNNLYLYIPLLTMGLMSRDLGSGAIKLFYSSPITNRQIIIGKYLSIMIFGLLLVSILAGFGWYGFLTIENADMASIFCALLGIYLLICAYAAVGLFMSSLTPYMVVAAIGTLAIFSLLNYFKGIGQSIEFVRDITYWVGISGRVNTFIRGLITSEDLIYFLTVIGLFLSLTILRLQAGRQKIGWLKTWGRYAIVLGVAALIGYFSTRPKLMGYIDATSAKSNTLNKKSQEVLSKLPEDATITTYVNMLAYDYFYVLPDQYKYDVERFSEYTRFRPDIKMKYVYFYHRTDNPSLDERYPKLSDKQRIDTLTRIENWKFDILPYAAISKEVDLAPENYRTVRVIETKEGRKSFLRMFNDSQHLPGESEISAAFKRLIIPLPVVGFIEGQRERQIDDVSDRGYSLFSSDKTFRFAMINQGFDIDKVSLDRPIPAAINILVLAEMRDKLTVNQQKNLDDYIGRCGNMMIIGEPGRQDFMNQVTVPLGVKFLPGILVNKSAKIAPTLLTLNMSKSAGTISHYFESIVNYRLQLTMPTANAMEITPGKGFKVTPLFSTDVATSWNELQTTNFVDDSLTNDVKTGEVKKSYVTTIGLSRKIANKEQKIIMTSDADWLSNGELGMNRKEVFSANYLFINGAFYWLSNGEVPIDTRRPLPTDNSFKIKERSWLVFSVFQKWIFPLLVLTAGLVIWIRRKGR